MESARGAAKACVGGLLTAALLSCNCTSVEDKDRIRHAVSAFELASDNSPANRKALMGDLQNAVDAVPDGDARNELLRCQGLLELYRSRQSLIAAETLLSLAKTGLGKNSTDEDFDLSYARATAASPLPDFAPIARCAVITLPAFAK
jgi:hypothetical protein